MAVLSEKAQEVDISSALVRNIVVHRVGNKVRDEGYSLSRREAERTESLDDLLLRHYLAPAVRSGEELEFHHESDLSLNTVLHFAKQIYSDPKTFLEHSQSIAKHLYSSSTHPNIGGGELIVILFEDIRVSGNSQFGLGLFRIEGRDAFLDVSEDKGSLGLIEKSGISIEKIQKGALSLSSSSRVYVVDSLGQKTKYWLDGFLKVVPCETPKNCARVAGDLLRSVSAKLTKPEDALGFGQQIRSRIANSDGLSIGEIRSISESYLEPAEFSSILSGISDRSGFAIQDDLEVDNKRLLRFAKEVTSRTRIADGISLVVSNPDARVSGIEVKKTKAGFRATIDIQIEGAI